MERRRLIEEILRWNQKILVTGCREKGERRVMNDTQVPSWDNKVDGW